MYTEVYKEYTECKCILKVYKEYTKCILKVYKEYTKCVCKEVYK